MINRSMFSTGKDDWETPDELFHEYNLTYNFVLDAAGDLANHKCDVWFGPDSPVQIYDALDADWGSYLRQGNIWLNPPYSRGLQKRFVEKARDEVNSVMGYRESEFKVVCLLPARTDTKLFHETILPNGDVTFLKGRVKFINPDGELRKGHTRNSAPFPSMIVVF